MIRRGIQLSARHRRWFYAVTALLFASGFGWSLMGWLAQRNEGHADAFRAMKPKLLAAHGALAMAFLVAMGILIPTHIKRGWQANRNRANGEFLVGVTAVLVVTGYGLYYFGDEQLREATSWTHVALGLGSPFILLLHIWLGRRLSLKS